MNERISKDGICYSVNPCTAFLTFAYWIYLVPQYKPESVLMLGYAGGTTAGLIRKLYGDVPITAVDIDLNEPLYGETFIQADAEEYVKTCGKFDTVIVDLFDGYTECPFVFSEQFVKNLERIGNYIIVGTINKPSLEEYEKVFDKVEMFTVGKGNTIHYFKKKGVELDLFIVPRSDAQTLRM